jgi:hypothetical protein
VITLPPYFDALPDWLQGLIALPIIVVFIVSDRKKSDPVRMFAVCVAVVGAVCVSLPLYLLSCLLFPVWMRFHPKRYVSIQLSFQDVTPNSQTQLLFIASGFRSGEPLVVTIEGRQRQIYARTTLHADKSGRLRETLRALPARLETGAYQLIVVGSTSHRRASATFQMHDIPPTVSLETHTETLKQVVNVDGEGFVPGEFVTISLEPSSTSAPVLFTGATGAGAVRGHLEIPRLRPGSYTLSVLGGTSQTPASVDFTVPGYSPWVVLDRTTLALGEGVGCIGRGFAPGELVFVYLNAPAEAISRWAVATVLHMTADFSGQVVVPDTWSPDGVIRGTNVLTFVGQSSQATAQAEFMVQAPGLNAGEPPATDTTP